MPALAVDIVPMQDEDLEKCASFITRRMLYYPHRLFDPAGSEEQRLHKKVAFLRQDLEHPGTLLFVAKRKSDGAIAGWMSWAIPDTKEGRSQTSVIEARHAVLVSTADTERDDPLIAAVRERKKAIEASVFGDKPHWTLQNLFVNPDMRRSGVGSQMVQFGIELTQKHTPLVTLIGFSASPMGRVMYEKAGFKVVDWFNYDILDWEDSKSSKLITHKHRWPYMSNYWDGVTHSLDAMAEIQGHEGPWSVPNPSQ